MSGRARAKGLSPLRVVTVHALRNALIPGHHGDRPGDRHPAGRRDPDRDDLLVARHRQVADRVRQAARLPDRCRGGVLLVATLIMTVNLLVDVLYGVVNPRIRHVAERNLRNRR